MIKSPLTHMAQRVEKHMRWYLRSTNRAHLIPRVTDKDYIALLWDTLYNAGVNPAGLTWVSPESQRAYLNRVMRTRISRITKFCTTEVMEFVIKRKTKELVDAYNDPWCGAVLRRL